MQGHGQVKNQETEGAAQFLFAATTCHVEQRKTEDESKPKFGGGMLPRKATAEMLSSSRNPGSYGRMGLVVQNVSPRQWLPLGGLDCASMVIASSFMQTRSWVARWRACAPPRKAKLRS